MLNFMIEAIERGMVPDPAIRFGIRRLCRERLKTLQPSTGKSLDDQAREYVEKLKRSRIATHTDDANRQHYELPPEFFTLVLGKNRKYSSAFWPERCRNLDDAEEAALCATIERAELADGTKILELGCGWGSLTLSMARRFPNSQILALSNSAPQRQFIEGRALAEGLRNVNVITRNIEQVEDLAAEFGQFDRVVSVEMFEHLRNYEALLKRISRWLAPDGKLFVHIFTHRAFSYPFETEGEDNWMGKYFFTGGQMPAHDLLPRFQEHLALERDWAWDGTHYQRTAEAWLKNMDRHADEIRGIFDQIYGEAESARWMQRWRMFFMSCGELFGYRNGKEWGVSHYLFQKPGA